MLILGAFYLRNHIFGDHKIDAGMYALRYHDPDSRGVDRYSLADGIICFGLVIERFGSRELVNF